MSAVDAKYRFLWGSCGFPGNSHDSIILQSTSLWSDIQNGKVLPSSLQNENDVNIPPLLIGDAAFPLEPFLMKPFTNAVLSTEQHYFNYRLSRARMTIECAYGQLKGRWRHLMKKSEGGLYETKTATLACMVLHNLCIEYGDKIPASLDLSVDPVTSQTRNRNAIRDILMMCSCKKVNDSQIGRGCTIRDAIKRKLWEEKCKGKEFVKQ